MAGIVEKLQKMWNPPDDEYDEYYEDEATGAHGRQPRGAAFRTPFVLLFKLEPRCEH